MSKNEFFEEILTWKKDHFDMIDYVSIMKKWIIWKLYDTSVFDEGRVTSCWIVPLQNQKKEKFREEFSRKSFKNL